jgi:hypothetical protein
MSAYVPMYRLSTVARRLSVCTFCALPCTAAGYQRRRQRCRVPRRLPFGSATEARGTIAPSTDHPPRDSSWRQGWSRTQAAGTHARSSPVEAQPRSRASTASACRLNVRPRSSGRCVLREPMPPRDHPTEQGKPWTLAPTLRGAAAVRNSYAFQVVPENGEEQEPLERAEHQLPHDLRLEPLQALAGNA